MPQRESASAADLHVPVLLERCLDLLAPAFEGVENPVMIDATLGMGGHTEGALARFPQLRVVGIDRDPQAIALASERLATFGSRFRAFQGTYDQIDEVARRYSLRSSGPAAGTVDGILMDLGVSSLQLDDASRGFSYARPAPIDMRMDQSAGRTAQDILDSASAGELTRILRVYGEERFASRIAGAIVREREAGRPVQDTASLAELVRASIPAATRRSGGHPAKRTFQALRIAVNAELEVLERAIPRALNAVRAGGHVVVESYQSLEDRIVKHAFQAGISVDIPHDLPVIPDNAGPYLRALTHGAELANEADIAANPRSAPVRLRAVERIREASLAPTPEPAESSPGNARGKKPAARCTSGPSKSSRSKASGAPSNHSKTTTFTTRTDRRRAR